ncbi:MAG: hypothetical protein BZY88_20070 [SAR202 cluster bacterium Io17-Chloro-G9]|nr:MAG: hypothetical protein BZY88_20070 [SAR202 cluster bacterium Io17-Chloro-G9]
MRYLTRSASTRWLLTAMLSLAIFAVACGTSAVPEPRVIEKEVIKEVIKEVPGKDVIKEVIKEIPGKDVIKEIEIVKEVVVVATPGPVEPGPIAINPGKLTVMVPDFSSERFDRLWAAGEGATAYMSIVHGHLVESDAERTMIPGIASEWSISPDGKSYSYRIRKGVKWHDGTELTPEDVLWTYQHSYGAQALDYAIGSGFLKAARIVDQISLTEPDVVTISFTKPYLEYQPGISNTSSSPDPILPLRAALNDIEVSEAYDRNPIGVGAMRLTKHVPQSLMRFERFPDHYFQPANGFYEDRRVNFQTLDLLLVSEMSTRVAALRAGEVDIIPVSISAKSQVEKGGGRLVYIPEAVAFDNPWIHCWATEANHPCRSKQVRQALNYSINKELLRDKLYGGPDLFEVGGLGFITPSVMGYTDALVPFPFDPEKARKLLSDAGYPGGAGFPTPIVLNVAPSGVLPFMVEAAQFITDSWKKELKIPAEVVTHDYSGMKKKRRTDELDGEFYFSRKATSINPTSNVFRFYGSLEEDKRRATSNEALTLKVGEATQMTDIVAQQKALEELLPAIRDEALTLNLGYANTPWGVGPRVETWTPWPLTDYASALWTVTLK